MNELQFEDPSITACASQRAPRAPRRARFVRRTATALLMVLYGGLSATSAFGVASHFEAALEFGACDRDGDGAISDVEWKATLDGQFAAPPRVRRALFDKLDDDGDGAVSATEFAARRPALLAFLEQFWLEATVDDPVDPGPQFVPYDPSRPVIDDAAVYGATYHRHRELTRDATPWAKLELGRLPLAVASPAPPWRELAGDQRPRELAELVAATLIIAAGEGDDFFTAGAVLISPDGLALTNYHVGEYIRDKMTALSSDGRCRRVTQLLAGNAVTDTALIRIEGDDLPWVPLAKTPPAAGEEIVVVHHPENRFYTFDRGYVMRYSLVGGVPTMEISAPYAPGASGCGIYNAERELVGLVSSIAVGDGPFLADSFGDFGDEPLEHLEAGEAEEEESEDFALLDDASDLLAMDTLVVKHAVPLQSLLELHRAPPDEPTSAQLADAKNAAAELQQRLRAGEWDKASQLMTRRGQDAFCVDQVDALRAAREESPDALLLALLVERHGLQPALDALDSNDPPRVIDARVLESLEASGDRWKVVAAICHADRQRLLESWSPLFGQVVDAFAGDDAVILVTRMDPEEEATFDPPVYIRLSFADGAWRYDGIDWVRTDAARLQTESAASSRATR